MFFSDGSTPTTVAPSLAIGSRKKSAAAADVEKAQALEGLALEGIAAKRGRTPAP